MLYACNSSGFTDQDLSLASKYGVVSYDWSNAKRLWQKGYSGTVAKMDRNRAMWDRAMWDRAMRSRAKRDEGAVRGITNYNSRPHTTRPGNVRTARCHDRTSPP